MFERFTDRARQVVAAVLVGAGLDREVARRAVERALG